MPTYSFGTPSRWLIVFRRRADVWWVNWVPGRFKHVSAFGYVHECDAWVFYDCGLWTSIYVSRGTAARYMMLERTPPDAAVLSMAPLQHPTTPRWPVFSCTAAMANLLCIPTVALLPTALYNACIRHGAKIIQYGQAADADRRPDRSDAGYAKESGADGSVQGAADRGAG